MAGTGEPRSFSLPNPDPVTVTVGLVRAPVMVTEEMVGAGEYGGTEPLVVVPSMFTWRLSL